MKEILSIEFKHEYYSDGKCKNMKVHPSDETHQWINQYRLSLKQIDNQVKLFAPSDMDVEYFVTTLSTQLQFDFSIESPTFLVFTEIITNGSGKLVFDYELNEGDTIDAPIELESKIEETSNFEDVVTVSINLTELKSILEQPLQFIVQFKARRVSLRYYIINKHNHSSLELRGNDAALFKGPSNSTIQNVTPAILFNSEENKIAFKENPTMNLELWGIQQGESKPKLLIKPLPQINPSLLKMDNQNELCTEAYVYL